MKRPTDEQILAAAEVGLADKIDSDLLQSAKTSAEPVELSVKTEVRGFPGQRFEVKFLFSKTADRVERSYTIIR